MLGAESASDSEASAPGEREWRQPYHVRRKSIDTGAPYPGAELSSTQMPAWRDFPKHADLAEGLASSAHDARQISNGEDTMKASLSKRQKTASALDQRPEPRCGTILCSSSRNRCEPSGSRFGTESSNSSCRIVRLSLGPRRADVTGLAQGRRSRGDESMHGARHGRNIRGIIAGEARGAKAQNIT